MMERKYEKDDNKKKDFNTTMIIDGLFAKREALLRAGVDIDDIRSLEIVDYDIKDKIMGLPADYIGMVLKINGKIVKFEHNNRHIGGVYSSIPSKDTIITVDSGTKLTVLEEYKKDDRNYLYKECTIQKEKDIDLNTDYNPFGYRDSNGDKIISKVHVKKENGRIRLVGANDSGKVYYIKNNEGETIQLTSNQLIGQGFKMLCVTQTEDKLEIDYGKGKSETVEFKNINDSEEYVAQYMKGLLEICKDSNTVAELLNNPKLLDNIIEQTNYGLGVDAVIEMEN